MIAYQPVTPEQDGHQRVEGRKKEQLEVVEHGRKGGRGEEVKTEEEQPLPELS